MQPKDGPDLADQGVGRPRGSAEHNWRYPGPAFLWTTDRWALVLILGCILLGMPILSGLWALLLSETQVQDIPGISSVVHLYFHHFTDVGACK